MSGHTPGLLPCPFCGAKAEHDVVTQGGEANPDFGGHFIQCTNTRCHGCMGLRFACGDDPKPALFDAWNTRTGLDPAAVEDAVAALEAIEAEGLRNHNTRCRPWWKQARTALARIRGAV